MPGRNIKVAVRVRPFTAKEQEQRVARAVSIRDYPPKLVITNPVTKEERQFPFDYVYNDCPEANEGEARPLDGQAAVYEEVGDGMLFDAFDGINTCLFAYGQAGSGKTYSIVGRPGEDGLLLRICETLVQGLTANQQVQKGCTCIPPPPPCASYALVQATVGVGTVLIWDLI